MEDRLEIAEKLILIMDKLFKENNMSLVVRKGKPVVMDHENGLYYRIEHKEEVSNG